MKALILAGSLLLLPACAQGATPDDAEGTSSGASDTDAGESQAVAGAGSVEAPPPELVRTVDEIYAPYTRPNAIFDADWYRIPFAPQTMKLVNQWEDSWTDGVDELGSYGWLCECQDWDAASFEYEIVPVDGDTVDVSYSFDGGPEKTTRFDMVPIDGEWLVDDMTTESLPDGVKAALREAIAN